MKYTVHGVKINKGWKARPKKKKRTKKDIWKNGKKSKYMRDPDSNVKTVTYYPDRRPPQ